MVSEDREATTTARREWDELEDPLPDGAVEKILELVDRLPREFEVPNGIDATHKGKATLRILFPGVADVFKVADLAETMLHAVTLTETLARNLAYERGLLGAAGAV